MIGPSTVNTPGQNRVEIISLVGNYRTLQKDWVMREISGEVLALVSDSRPTLRGGMLRRLGRDFGSPLPQQPPVPP